MPISLTGVEEMLQSILLVIAITFVRDRVLDSVAILDANSLQVRGVGLSALCDKIVSQRSFRSLRLPMDFRIATRYIPHDRKKTGRRLRSNRNIAKREGREKDGRLGEEHGFGVF